MQKRFGANKNLLSKLFVYKSIRPRNLKCKFVQEKNSCRKSLFINLSVPELEMKLCSPPAGKGQAGQAPEARQLAGARCCGGPSLLHPGTGKYNLISAALKRIRSLFMCVAETASSLLDPGTGTQTN